VFSVGARVTQCNHPDYKYVVEAVFNDLPIDLSNYSEEAGGWPLQSFAVTFDDLTKVLSSFKDYLVLHATPDFIRECCGMQAPTQSILEQFKAQFGESAQINGPYITTN
jgi:hypothetical protein